jgi:hypothetical protein
MTEADVREIEQAVEQSSLDDPHGEVWKIEEHEGSDIHVTVAHVRALIAEVRRLQEIERDVQQLHRDGGHM